MKVQLIKGTFKNALKKKKEKECLIRHTWPSHIYLTF